MKRFNTQTLEHKTYYNTRNNNIKSSIGRGFLFFLFTLLLGGAPNFIFAQVLQRYQNTGSFVFTVPGGVTTIKVEAWGAGGGGAQNPFGSPNDAAGGGGGGAYATSVLDVIPGQTYLVLVGAGGLIGVNGGTTQFSEGFGASNILVRAEGGFRGDEGGRPGGRASESIGQFRFSGGAGGNSNGTTGGGGGGGGSALISAAGGVGANGLGNTGGNGGVGTGNGGRGGNNAAGQRDGLNGSEPGAGGGGKGGSGAGTSGSGADGLLVISVPGEVTYNTPLTGTPNFYSFTVPQGVTQLTIDAWGGGGGGGVQGNDNARPGGGGGAFVRRILPVTPGQVYRVIVGQGGTPGNNGTASTFASNAAPNTFLVSANGGTTGGNTTPGSGGDAGTSLPAAGAGVVKFSGGAGGNRPNNTGGGSGGGGSAFINANGGTGGAQNGALGGAGGVGTGAGGAGGSTTVRNGSNGFAPGGGGGGKGSGNPRGTSGSGANGQVSILWVSTLPYNVRYASLSSGSPNWCTGETRTIKIITENNGTSSWTSGIPNGRVNLYYWWSNQSRATSTRVEAFNPVLPPGDLREVSITLTAPTTPGNYTLNFDMRVEGNCWFSDNNGLCGPGNSLFSSPQIGVVSQPTVNAGNIIATCSNAAPVNITAGASASNQDFVIWSPVTGTGLVGNPNSLTTATYAPSPEDIVAGSATIGITAVNEGCSAFGSKVINISRAPVLSIGPNLEICTNIPSISFATGVTATNTTSITWTSNGTGTLNNPNSLNGATYAPSSADKSSGSVTFTLSAIGSGGCTDPVLGARAVSFVQEPSAFAGSALSICSNAKNFPIATGAQAFNSSLQLWTTNGDGALSNETSLTGATYSPGPADSINGSVILTLRAGGNGNCADALSTKVLTIAPVPSVFAGPNLFICDGTPNLNIGSGALATQTTGVLWTTSGTGTFTNPTSLTGAVYTPSAADRTNGSVVLTLTGTGTSPCTSAISTKTLAMIPAINATISYAQTAFCSNAGLQNVNRIGTPGGTYSFTPAIPGRILVIDPQSGQVNPQTSDPGTYTVVYSIPAGGGCPAFSTNTSITITQLREPNIIYGTPIVVGGNPATTYFCTSENNPQSPTLTGSGILSGGSYSFAFYTPESSSPLNLNTSTGTIQFPSPNSPLASQTYEITYTLPASGGCPQVTAQTLVRIVLRGNAAISYPTSPFCANKDTARVRLTGNATGTVGGSFSALAGGLVVDPQTGTIDILASAPGTYTNGILYTVPVQLGCPTIPVTAITSVTINPIPIAAFSYTSNPYCTNSGTISPTFSAGGVAGNFSATPAGLSINATNGQIDAALSTPGTYLVTNIRAASNGCAQVSANSPITITRLPVANFSYTGTPFCQNALNPAPAFSGGGTAGTFSAPGGLAIVPATGVVNLAASTPGSYTVTNAFPALNGCPAVSFNASIAVTPVPTASISYSNATYCNDLATPQPVTLSGTGTFTGGSFSVSPVGLPINTTDGTITTQNAPPNNYIVTYIVPAFGGCGSISANTAVAIVPRGTLTLTSATTTQNQTLCINTPITNVTYNLGGTANTANVTGLPAGVGFTLNAGVLTIHGAPTVSGNFSYTITASGNCPDATATGTIEVRADPVLTLASLPATQNQNICAGSPIVNIQFSVNGFVTGVNVSGLPAGVNFTYVANTVTISGTPTVNGVFTYTVQTTGPCVNASVSGTIRRDASIPTPPSVITGVSGLCPPLSGISYEATPVSGAAIYNWVLPTGWSITSGAGSNQITVALSGATAFGNNILQVSAANGCGASSNTSLNVLVNNFAGVTIAPVAQICEGSNIPLVAAFSGAASSGLWQIVSGSGTITNPSNATTSYAPSAADITNGTVTLKNTTDQVAGICLAGQDQITVMIKRLPTASIAGAIPICQGGNAVLTITGTPNTSVTYTINGGVSQNISIGGTGTAQINTGALTANATYELTQIAYANGESCTQTLGSSAIVTVNPLVVVNAGTAQTVCSGGQVTLNGSITGGITTGTWSAATGTFGNNTQLNTTYTPSIGSGNVVLTLTSDDPVGPCTVQSATVTITVNPAATVSAGTNQTLCQGSVASLQGTFGGGATGVSWSGGTGTYSNVNSPVSNYTPIINSGVETLTITTNDPDGAGPCAAVFATVNIGVEPAPTVSAGPNQNICASGVATMAGVFGGSASIATWSTSGTGTFSSPTAGNTVYTPSAADKAAGSVTISYTTNDPAGSCTAAVSSMTLTLSPIPLLIVNAGSAVTVCQGLVVNLNGSIGGSATSATWSAPSGTFGNPSNPITNYTPSITSGSVVLTLTTNNPDGPCDAQSSSVTVTVNTAPATPPDPVGPIVACGNPLVNRNGNPPAGVTWYWQDVPTGQLTTRNATDPLLVLQSNTFYINARDNASGCWSLGQGSVQVTRNANPPQPNQAISVNLPSPQCEGTTFILTRGANPSGSIRWYWQTTPNGTSTDSSGLTYTATSAGTYYLRTQNNSTGCWSDETISVDLAYNPLPANPAAPTTNGPQCADVGTTIAQSGTPPPGIEWFWQSTPLGTSASNSVSSFTVSTSGMHYLRARNATTGCWSPGSGSVSAVVNPLPGTPPNPTTNGAQCTTVTLTFNGTPPSGTLWYWQTTANGTSISNNTSPFNVTTPGTYYLRARTNDGCWSTLSGQATATFLSIPATPTVPTSNSPQCSNLGVTLTRQPDPALNITWYWQGTNPNGTSTADNNTTFLASVSGTYYLRARNSNGCWSQNSAALTVIVNPLPGVPTGTFTITGNNNCEDVGVTLTRNGVPVSPVAWYWQTNPAETLETNQTNQYLSRVVGNNYPLYLRAKNTLTGCWSNGVLTSPNISVRPNPVPNIAANYCGTPGKVVLNVSASPTPTSFNWQPVLPGAVNGLPSYLVDVAGVFTVNVTYPGGCTRSNFIQVAENLVFNGDFTQGNVGFQTERYAFRADLAGRNDELIPEGLYGVGTNGQNYHPNFWGIDRTANTTGPRNMMIVNGLGTEYIVWKQVINVEPNKDYYFSAYAMSINQVPPYARLRFDIKTGPNDSAQVGTIAELGPGPANTIQANANNNWTRFYSEPVWNSGSISGPITLRIVNLETALGGNDFAIDDINFGTLTALPLNNTMAFVSNPGCAVSPVTLSATFQGGKAPFQYQWAGPNGYTSTAPNPTVPASFLTPGENIQFTLNLRDAFGCDPAAVNTNTIAIPDSLVGRGEWTGNGNDLDWYNCLNWRSGTIPWNQIDVSLVNVPGDVLIRKASGFYNGKALARNLNIDRPLRLNNQNDTLEVYGNLHIQSGNGLLNTSNGGEITMLGTEWRNSRGVNGFLSGPNSRVRFKGIAAAPQQIINTGGLETFYNLTIENTNIPVINVIANTPINVSDRLELINGRVLTTNTNLLTVTNPSLASVTGGSLGSYIHGPMARQMNTTNPYYFPIGKNGSPYMNYRPASVILKSATNHRFRAEYNITATPDLVNKLDIIEGMINNEWWDISRQSGTDSARVVLNYITPPSNSFWHTLNPPDNQYNVAIVKYSSPVIGSGGWAFSPYFSADQSGYDVSLPESINWEAKFAPGTPVYSKFMMNFSPFTFGYAFFKLLPIQLVDFTAILHNKQAWLQWTVADNEEVRYFEVEHSTDGQRFSKVGQVNKGSNPAYQFLHGGLVSGNNYYRLQMVGKDGTRRMSKIVVVSYGRGATYIVGLNPTVVKDMAQLKVLSATGQAVQIRVMDMHGRLIRTEKAPLQSGNNVVPVYVRGLANGMYIIQAYTEDGAQATYKILKE